MGKVSIVGTGIQSAPGFAARMFRTLSDAGINIEMISTSEIRITCIIPEDRVADAVRALHKAFELEKAEASGARRVGSRSSARTGGPRACVLNDDKFGLTAPESLA